MEKNTWRGNTKERKIFEVPSEVQQPHLPNLSIHLTLLKVRKDYWLVAGNGSVQSRCDCCLLWHSHVTGLGLKFEGSNKHFQAVFTPERQKSKSRSRSLQDSLATFDLVRFGFTLQLKEHNKGTELGENVSTGLAPCHYPSCSQSRVPQAYWVDHSFFKGIFTMKLEEGLKIAEIVFFFSKI